jgi:hypothetical protein
MQPGSAVAIAVCGAVVTVPKYGQVPVSGHPRSARCRTSCRAWGSATLVPAYLLVVPLRLPPDAPMEAEVARALPLLEAVEQAALRAGVPVDARIEKGRTPTHALQQIWEEEPFTRVIAAAPHGRAEGFTPKDMTWILTHAPVETLVLRPTPEAPVRPDPVGLRFAAKRLADAAVAERAAEGAALAGRIRLEGVNQPCDTV